MWQKRINSFKYAFTGIATLVRTQVNAKVHLVCAVLVIGAGCFFSISFVEWCLVVIAIGFVLAAEAFNTAIEFLTDLVSPEYHELAGKTKDLAAGAVLIAAVTAIAIGLFIFLPKLAIIL